jgi:hypothetical protein
MTKVFFLSLALSLCAGAAAAQIATSCHARASDKHLAGAALTSFMNKCERDSGKVCEDRAADKKLHGAAKTSFMQKCIRDAVGS